MKKSRFSKEEEQFIVDNYPTMFASEIAKVLGRKTSSIHQKAAAMGVRSSAEKARLSGEMTARSEGSMRTRFPKGHVPANKGKKLRPETYARCAATMFKKGQTPLNHRAVGSERVNVDGYREIKVAEPNKWESKHRVIWQQHNGDIPKGYNIQFKDGDRLNCDINNLYIISRAEQMGQENCLTAKYPKDLQYVIRLKGALNRQINKIKKAEINEE